MRAMSDLKNKTVVFGSDHGALALRAKLIENANLWGMKTVDTGPTTSESVDYPQQVKVAVEKFQDLKADFLVLLCGSGIGVSIAANRFPDIRAVVTHSVYAAKLAREHNHANCLCMGERLVGPDQAREVMKAFFETESSTDERHQRRVRQLGGLNE